MLTGGLCCTYSTSNERCFSEESDHLKIPQCVFNRLFLIRRADQHLCALGFCLVAALLRKDPILLLDLCDVQGRNLETAVRENIRLDLLIGCAFLKLGDVQSLKRESTFTERCGDVSLEKHITVSTAPVQQNISTH